MEDRLRILFVAAEVAPLAKVGGLGDVAASLPKALAQRGHDVRVIMPKYGFISRRRYRLVKVIDAFLVPLGEKAEPAALWRTSLGEGLSLYLVENGHYFGGRAIYGRPDDVERFLYFSWAALEALKLLFWRPDVVHCHDWHTAIIPYWLKARFSADPFYADVASVLTIHNLAYQGICDLKSLSLVGLRDGFVGPVILGRGGCFDLLSQGILHADVINTVSPSYAREILSPEYGEGLDRVLVYRRRRLFGIINGIDYQIFNPANDPYIAANYTQDTLSQRAENKAALQRKGNLALDSEVPVVGMVTRLVDQKGLDLVAAALEHLLGRRAQFVLLGKGEPSYHRFFRKAAARHPGTVAVFLGYDPALAQQIYAGCDIFLMPSRFEPCGLGQLIALRYGAILLVRRTGGLADTIQDYDPATGQGNGFVFEDYSPQALTAAAERAFEVFRNKEAWHGLMVQAMATNVSWEASAQRYEALYERAISLRREEWDL